MPIPINHEWTLLSPYRRGSQYVTRFRSSLTGKTRTVSTGRTTKRDAIAFAREWAQERLVKDRRDVRFAVAWSEYLAGKDIRAGYRTTLTTDGALYLRHLGETRAVSSYGPEDIETMLRHLKDEGRSQRTRQKHRSALRTFFTWAQRRGYCEKNPTDAVDAPSATPEKTRRALTLEEQRRLLDASRESPRHVRWAVYLALRLGLRKGNVLGMRWEWVDWDQETLTVPADEFKAKRAHRLPLPRDVRLFLRLRRQAVKKSDLVLGKEVGSMRTAFETLRRRAGIERETNEGKVDFHSLRTTFGTHVAQVASYGVTKRALGHSFASGDVSLRYLRPSDDEVRAALETMGNPLRMPMLGARLRVESYDTSEP